MIIRAILLLVKECARGVSQMLQGLQHTQENGQTKWPSIINMLSEHERVQDTTLDKLSRDDLSKKLDAFLFLKVCSKTGKEIGRYSTAELNQLVEINGIERAKVALIHANVCYTNISWLYTDGVALDKLMDIDPIGYYIYALTQLISFRNISTSNQLLGMKYIANKQSSSKTKNTNINNKQLNDFSAPAIELQFTKAKYLLYKKIEASTSLEDVRQVNKSLHKHLTLSKKLHKSGYHIHNMQINPEQKISTHPLSEKWAFNIRFDEMLPLTIKENIKQMVQQLILFYNRSAKLRRQAIEHLENVSQDGASNFINQYKRSTFIDIDIVINALIEDVDPYSDDHVIESEMIARRMMHKIAQKKGNMTQEPTTPLNKIMPDITKDEQPKPKKFGFKF